MFMENETNNEVEELDRFQAAYREAVEAWVAAIRQEEALAAVEHSVADIDKWEQAGFREEELRTLAKDAKKKYEAALRMKYYDFK